MWGSEAASWGGRGKSRTTEGHHVSAAFQGAVESILEASLMISRWLSTARPLFFRWVGRASSWIHSDRFGLYLVNQSHMSVGDEHDNLCRSREAIYATTTSSSSLRWQEGNVTKTKIVAWRRYIWLSPWLWTGNININIVGVDVSNFAHFRESILNCQTIENF